MKRNTQINFAVIQVGFVLKCKRPNTVKRLLVAQLNITNDNLHRNPLNKQSCNKHIKIFTAIRQKYLRSGFSQMALGSLLFKP